MQHLYNLSYRDLNGEVLHLAYNDKKFIIGLRHLVNHKLKWK